MNKLKNKSYIGWVVKEILGTITIHSGDKNPFPDYLDKQLKPKKAKITMVYF